MAIRDNIRRKSQPLLEPGETIEGVLYAQTGPSPYLVIITYLFAFLWKFVIIVATDRRIVVIRSGWFTRSAKEVIATFPRGTTLGPVSGVWGKVHLGGVRYWVHRRFHHDVRQIDAAAVADPAGATRDLDPAV